MDTNVRFRATYYFRTFDYCWASDKQGDQYRLIVPETEVLYRYRMTGKASALANRIHFESAIMDASQIDPFGAKLGIYDVKVSDPASATQGQQVQADAQERATAMGFAGALPSGSPLAPSERAPEAASGSETQTPDTSLEGMLAACKDAKVNRGFMIMGPEGMKQFDQSQRLVLAMTSSADPLIQTLQEYSGRVLAKSDPAGDLVPLVQEGQRTREALNALGTAEGKMSVEDMAQAALDAFGKVEAAR